MEEGNKWLSRKLAFAISSVATTSALLVLGYIPPGVFENVVIAVIFGYLGSQAIVDFRKQS